MTSPTTPPPATLTTCAECRHHSITKRPKIMDSTGFGDQLMFEDKDKDESVYWCRAPDGTPGAALAGKEIGLVPLVCNAWSAVRTPSQERLAELDRMIAAREARPARDGEE